MSKAKKIKKAEEKGQPEPQQSNKKVKVDLIEGLRQEVKQELKDEAKQEITIDDEERFEPIRLGGIISKKHNWWEEEEDPNQKDTFEKTDVCLWKYLEHHGVLFPPFYKRHHKPLIFDGQPIELTEEQEEYCTYWAQSMGTEYETKAHYRNNFNGFMKGKFTNIQFELEKCDFSLIKKYLEEQKELKKVRSEEVKKQEKADKEQRDKLYSYGLVDGCLEKVGNFTLEQPTLFKGRGKHPKAGLPKARQNPEDLTINVSSQAPIPRCSLPGHSWGNIVSRSDVTWLVSYVDSSVKKDNHKYVQFAASSRFKQMNDKKKYEKARRLKNCIDSVREDYNLKLESDNIKQRQLGTATYLIDKLALRVGNEKDEDEADTVGCCSLRVEHIVINDDNKIVFDFLGKDSMRYYNEVRVDPKVWENMKIFQKGKKPEMNLFSEISTDDLNDYLKTQMKGLTAKVFRTYNASCTLQQQLDKQASQLERLDDMNQKVNIYDLANKEVAILCNHQKTIPKSYEINKQKINFKIEIFQQYQLELEAHLRKKRIEEYEQEVDLEPPGSPSKEKDVQKKKGQIFVKKFPGEKDKVVQQIDKIKSKIKGVQDQLNKREENKEIALGTSKTNYNDPRISVAWCKQYDVPIEKVFTQILRNKFIWAMSTDSRWKF